VVTLKMAVIEWRYNNNNNNNKRTECLALETSYLAGYQKIVNTD